MKFEFKKNSTEKFCKFCGRELELGRCYCDDFIASKSEPQVRIPTKECDTCHRDIPADSVYCPCCGMPLLVDGDNKELQKELRGETSKDVIKVYAKQMKPKDSFLFPLSFVVSTSVAALLVGVLFGYLIIPEIKKAVFNYNFSRQAEMNNELYEEPNYDAETTEGAFPGNEPVAQEVAEPTAPAEAITTPSAETSTSTSIEASTNSSDADEDSGEETDEEEPEETTETEETAKKVELWLEKANRVDDTVTNGTDTCQIIYYHPTINGEDPDEVKLLTDLYQYVFIADFLTQVKEYAISNADFPLSIVFDVPKDQGGTGKIYRLKLTGHVTHKSGLKDTIRFTIIYNRSTNAITVQKT